MPAAGLTLKWQPSTAVDQCLPCYVTTCLLLSYAIPKNLEIKDT